MGHRTTEDLTLKDLVELGDAAVRAIHWVSAHVDEEFVEESEGFCRALTQVGGDPRLLRVEPPAAVELRNWSWTEGNAEDWYCELWAPEEVVNVEERATWLLIFRGPHRAEFQLRTMLADLEFCVDLATPGSERVMLVPFTDGLRGMLHFFKEHPSIRKQLRGNLQGLDALTRHPVVVIDPNWRDRYLRETVMAQVAEWIVRVDSSEYSSVPRLSGDAYEWWGRWATRLAGRKESEGALSLGEVAEVAMRSIRPTSPAAHRLYWRRSLARHDDSLLLEAAGAVGISRRGAYDRLRRGGVHLRDFGQMGNPFQALVDYLFKHGPKSRLPADRRQIILALVEVGMKKEAARKFERRIRSLSSEDQKIRIEAALRRSKGRGPD